MRGFRPGEVTCPRCGIAVIPDRIRRRRARVYAMPGRYSQREIAGKLGVSQSCVRKDIAVIRRALGIPAGQVSIRPGPKPGTARRSIATGP